MRVSKRKVNEALEKELFSTFYQLIADLKNPKEAEAFFSDVLGKNELTSIVKRVSIAYWLSKGRTVTNIKENLAVSSATIETIKHELSTNAGLKLAVKKISADEWATNWTNRVRKLIR